MLQANHQRQRQRQQLQRLKFQIQVIVSTSLAPVPISFCPGLPARVQGLWRGSPQVRAFLLPQAALVTAGGRQSVLWSSVAGLPPGHREGAGWCSRSGSLAPGLQACGGQRRRAGRPGRFQFSATGRLAPRPPARVCTEGGPAGLLCLRQRGQPVFKNLRKIVEKQFYLGVSKEDSIGSVLRFFESNFLFYF